MRTPAPDTEHPRPMRVISMVPSWTETLLFCGARVVGRTRFCIHPESQIRSIPAVGGTKDIQWEKARSLTPDLLLLDREENPKFMAEEAECAVFDTHVRSVRDVSRELHRMAETFSSAGNDAVSKNLMALAARWMRLSKRGCERPLQSWPQLPGVVEWLQLPEAPPAEVPGVLYVIWKKPWMAVGRETFIASVLEVLGIPSEKLWPARSKSSPSLYPEFDFDDVPDGAVVLFSSEPYPFHKKKSELMSLPHPKAVVDGECFSWFGLRSLEFLERALGLSQKK